MVGLLEGKTAIVAGGGRGMGESVCVRFAAEGANVVVVDKVAERAHRVRDQIVDSGGRAISLVVNLRDDAQLPALVADTLAAYGTIDVLVNIAGGMRLETAWRPLREMEPTDWDFVFRQNVRWVQLLPMPGRSRYQGSCRGLRYRTLERSRSRAAAFRTSTRRS